MSSAEVDLELVRRVQQGEKRAYDLLVQKYHVKIIQLINRYVKDADEAQDVAQEAFIKAYRALAGFRGESAFYTWLYRIAINTAKNHLVAQSRNPAEPDGDLDIEEQSETFLGLIDRETPETDLLTHELASVIQSAFAELPEELRVALSLREFDGLSYDEIADVMSSPVGTVRSRIFRAREYIDKRIKNLMEANHER